MTLCSSSVLHTYIHAQLHTWAKLLGILMSVGGAIELTLTDNHEVPATLINGSSSDDNSHSSGVHYVGYIAVCFNTMLTVREGISLSLSLSLSFLHSYISSHVYTTLRFQAAYMLIQKRFTFGKPDCKLVSHTLIFFSPQRTYIIILCQLNCVF